MPISAVKAVEYIGDTTSDAIGIVSIGAALAEKVSLAYHQIPRSLDPVAKQRLFYLGSAAIIWDASRALVRLTTHKSQDTFADGLVIASAVLSLGSLAIRKDPKAALLLGITNLAFDTVGLVHTGFQLKSGQANAWDFLLQMGMMILFRCDLNSIKKQPQLAHQTSVPSIHETPPAALEKAHVDQFASPTLQPALTPQRGEPIDHEAPFKRGLISYAFMVEGLQWNAEINPKSLPITARYVGMGPDACSILYCTNARTIHGVDRFSFSPETFNNFIDHPGKIELIQRIENGTTILSGFEVAEALRMKQSSNFWAEDHIKLLGLERLLALELKLLGARNIRARQSGNKAVIDFEWAYPKEALKPRTIIYETRDLQTHPLASPSDTPTDVLFAKGSHGLTETILDRLQPLSQLVKPGGALMFGRDLPWKTEGTYLPLLGAQWTSLNHKRLRQPTLDTSYGFDLLGFKKLPDEIH